MWAQARAQPAWHSQGQRQSHPGRHDPPVPAPIQRHARPIFFKRLEDLRQPALRLAVKNGRNYQLHSYKQILKVVATTTGRINNTIPWPEGP